MALLHFARIQEKPEVFEVTTFFGDRIGWVKLDLRGWYFQSGNTNIHITLDAMKELYGFLDRKSTDPELDSWGPSA